MIIWINGPFGAGKTTLARKLQERRPAFLILDPEEIGFVVKATVPRSASGDYQDLPVWRSLTIAALAEIRRHYPQDILVPMTVVRPDYLDELLAGARAVDDRLVHVFLHLDASLLRARIQRQAMHPDPVRNAQIQQWRTSNIDRCLTARARMPPDTLFLDSGIHDPDDLAGIILDKLAHAPPQCRGR
ncbi:AAA family ATPase [Geminicoccus roseus]|uniref:AAA family ATPase n=1 Tax=Geminicoccus roseus TaxID=404900 RepID=UPI0003F573D2|nr:AAA family ATPase [Geminicoccus roseus]